MLSWECLDDVLLIGWREGTRLGGWDAPVAGADKGGTALDGLRMTLGLSGLARAVCGCWYCWAVVGDGDR